MSYIFRKAHADEAETVFSMISNRVKWMDEKGIRQWNVTDYLNVYPLEYYRNNIENMYLLIDETENEAVCASILFETDDRWNSDEPALYVHNFVSKPGKGGTGRIFIAKAEEYALKLGKLYLRLDSADDNEKLAAYYESLGFLPCGSCSDGEYHGTLREKKIR